jgi:hypothetical protein
MQLPTDAGAQLSGRSKTLPTEPTTVNADATE